MMDGGGGGDYITKRASLALIVGSCYLIGFVTPLTGRSADRQKLGVKYLQIKSNHV